MNSDDDMLDLTGYYLGFDNGDYYFANRKRLWIVYQLQYLSLQEWCFELDWVGV